MKFRVLITVLLLVTQFVIAEEKQTSEQLYQEAYESFVKRDYIGASAALDKINPVDQKKADILNLRGAIYKRLGELDNAANAYSDALKINPKDWVPKYNLAEVNFLREQYKSSRTYLEQALASMPEADRLQKQDLILYKVYLTYLLQGDEEKAKLLLESFDINSSNPVYYFAQAAWSFKKKDATKGKTWVNSTDGLYSQDLRNSYGQALVDIGWLEPSAGVGVAALTASPAPTTSPTEVVAAASPTPAVENASSIVPLATNNATPIAVVESTATPEASVIPATPSATVPDLAAINDEPKTEKENTFSWKTGLIIVAVLGIAFFWLMNLAKKSRIVPPPEDNTGYDAIVASGNSEATGAISYSSEGTGAVVEQASEEEHVPASIKPTPIQRDYVESELAPVALTTSVSRLAKTSAKPATRPSPKSVVKTKPTASLPVKKTPVTKPPVKAPPIALAAKTTTKASPNKPVKAAAKPAAKSVAIKASTVPISTPKKPSIAKTNPVVAASKTSATAVAKTVATPAPKASAQKSATAQRTRMISVPTINVPPPAVAPAKLMVSNIEKIKVDPSKNTAPASPAKTVAKAVPTKPKAPVKAVIKAPAKSKAPVKPKAPAKAPTPKAPAALITIPEFEDSNLETSSSPVIRLVPETAESGEKPQNT